MARCPLLARSSPTFRDVCALTLVAFLLNLVHLGARSVWLDEATSVAYGRLDLISLLRIVAGGDPNMGLYHLVLNFWVRIFGESEAAVRSLSAIFGALAASAVYLLGVRLYGRAAGRVAGLLFALNAFIVQYAQMARSYALLVLLVTLSSYYLVIELEQPSRASRLGYVITSTLAVYAHYFAVYVLVVHFATVVAMKRRGVRTREWLTVAAAILLLCIPAAVVAHLSGGTVWLSWITQPSVNDIGSVLVDFAGGSRLWLLALLACGSYATVYAVNEGRYWPQVFVAAWLVFPIALSFAVSFVRPMFIPRYLIISVPALVLFGASAIPRLRRPLPIGLLVASLVWLSAIQLLGYYRRDSNENWRDATRYVLAATQPGDALVFYPHYTAGPFEYYQRQSRVIGPTKLVASVPLEGRRIWLVIRAPDVERFSGIRVLQSSLAEKYRLVTQREFQGVGVELYLRKQPAP